MNLSPENINNFYQKHIKPIRDTWRGFLFFFFFFFLLSSYLLKNLGEINIFSSFLIFLLIFGGSILLSTIIWLCLRKKPEFKDEEIGILIGLTQLDRKVDKELIKLKNNLEIIITAEKLKTLIKVKFLPNRFTSEPLNKKEAHKLQDKTGAELIIWGNVDQGNINSEPHIIFSPISFSYKMPLPKKETGMLNENFTNLLKQKNWRIRERWNALDRKYIAKNIEEISLYIIGLILGFSLKDDKEKAIEILKKALAKFKNKQFQSRDDEIAIDNILVAADFNFRIQIAALELWPSNSFIKQHIKRAKRIIKEMKKIKELAPYSYVFETVVAFADNNFPRAKRKAQQAYSFSPNDPTTSFGMAFISYYEGNLQDGYKYLFQALQQKIDRIVGSQRLSIIRWYGEIIEKEPQKTYLNFPLGIINFDLIKEKIVAKECLKEFVQEYKNKKDNKIIRSMLYQAKKRLNKINRQGI